eukprot:UN29385
MNQLEQRLRRRQSVDQIQNRGILHRNAGLSNVLAPAVAKLEKKLHKRRRPSIDMLKQRGILNDFDTNHYPQEFIEKAMNHRKTVKADRLNDLLSNRASRNDERFKKYAKSDAYTSEDMAYSLQGPAALLNKKLKARPSVTEMRDKISCIIQIYLLKMQRQ